MLLFPNASVPQMKRGEIHSKSDFWSLTLPGFKVNDVGARRQQLRPPIHTAPHIHWAIIINKSSWLLVARCCLLALTNVIRNRRRMLRIWPTRRVLHCVCKLLLFSLHIHTWRIGISGAQSQPRKLVAHTQPHSRTRAPTRCQILTARLLTAQI